MNYTNVKILDDVDVHLEDYMGSDLSIVRAAQVSLKGKNEPIDVEKAKGLINYLMREKHGSPFEHTSMTFYVKAPIFVFREFHRHRAGFSYNEMSGRYTKLLPEFYAPNHQRPLINVGSSAKPEFAPGSAGQIARTRMALKSAFEEAWVRYEDLLEAGIANEVAREVLPVGVMSQMYATFNLRAAFNFIALRTKDERARHLSRPQHEIELVARKIEAEVERLFPVAYKAFNDNERVAP